MSATLTPPSPASAALSVRQSRVIRCSRTKAFEAWTDPTIMQQWFCPGGGRHAQVSLDPRPGGMYRIEMRGTSEAGEPLPTSVAEGVYTEVLAKEKLQFTWQDTWNPGNTSLVTVTFQDADAGTQVTVLHEKIVGDGKYEQGWARGLDEMTTILER